jgi:cell division septum initiation protein DivIVA
MYYYNKNIFYFLGRGWFEFMGDYKGKRHKRPVMNLCSAVLCLVLALSLIMSSIAVPVSAKSARSAKIVELSGTVSIKKAGGSKAYAAYEEMFLNEGDHITTGADSSVVLQIVDRDDEVTIGPDTEMFISSLTNDGGDKSKFKVWTGSLWFKVKKLVSDEDEFEMETPTAVMGVRGTSFYAETRNGREFLALLSGIVSVNRSGTTNNDDSDNLSTGEYIYPGQEASSFLGNEETFLTPLDIDDFVNSAPALIVQKLLENVAQIREENDQLAEQLADGTRTIPPNSVLDLPDQEQLDRYRGNLENLLANIARSAVDNGKLPKEQVEGIIHEANRKNPERAIDLNNVRPFDPNIGMNPDRRNEIEAKKREAEQRNENLRKSIREDLINQQNDLIKLVQEQAKAQEEANRKALEEIQKKVGSPKPVQPDPVRPNPPAQNPGPQTPSSPSTGNDDDDSEQGPISPVRVSASVSEVKVGDTFELSVLLNNLPGIYGAQVHILHDQAFVPETEAPVSDIFPSNESVSMLSPFYPFELEERDYEWDRIESVYAVIRDGSQESLKENISVTNEKALVKIPLRLLGEPSSSEILIGIKIVDNEGKVRFTNENQEAIIIKLNVKPGGEG